MMRFDLLQQFLAQILAPRITHRDIEREIRKVLARDPMKAERAVGAMYGYAFRKAEEAYAKRDSCGKHDWSGVPIHGG